MRLGRERIARRLRRSTLLLWVIAAPMLALASGTSALHVDISPPIPGLFDPAATLRDAKPLPLASADSIAGLQQDALLFQVTTQYDTASGYYISKRSLFGYPYGPERVFSRERYREWNLERDRLTRLRRKFRDAIYTPPQESGGGALEIQVPFRIRSKTFRRIFGGDRVGLSVTGNINIDGGLRREKSDQVVTLQTDQTNYNFKINQRQNFHITGKVGDKVSVEIDQDSEQMFDFNNTVKLTYQGYEDEIIQSIEAGNISLDLRGTQLATLSGKNQGLFGFKAVSKVGPLSITSVASLQKGEKNKLQKTGGSEPQSYPFDDRDLVRNQYFFLDDLYRENYRHYDANYIHPQPARTIQSIEVYKSARQNNQEQFFRGVAIYDNRYGNKVPDVPNDKVSILNLYNQYAAMDEIPNGEIATFKKLVLGNDYDVHENLGYIRMNIPAQTDEIIAVAYILSDGSRVGTYGPPGSEVILKELKAKTATSADENWNLSWKHVYWVGTQNLNLNDFSLNMYRGLQKQETTAEGKSWLEVFGLDRKSRDGSLSPDGVIDSVFINKTYGEIHFPDLRPFDPEGYYINDSEITAEIDTLTNPDIYDIAPSTNQQYVTNFNFEANYTSVSSDINLGFNVLEGSEEVYLNGRLLTKDKDYTIDYLSGRVVILDKSVTDKGSKLEINYESGEVFQLDKKTMIGVRLEYALWEDSFIGATLLYFNEKPIETRVKVGNEPLRNTIWDLNTRLRFKPYFLTQAVNALPLIDTDKPSEVSFEGEIAQVFPNPNSLNNSATGDDNGVAYIDDFESARRSTPMGVRRKSWFPASHPFHLPYLDQRSADDGLDYRGRLVWYNPYQQVPIQEIWPNRELNGQVAKLTDALFIEYDPRVNNFRSAQVDSSRTWNGIMRAISSGYYNQTTTRYIEIWMAWPEGGGGPNATLYIDMGLISEDVIPDKKLDTEDKPLPGSDVGNGILDDGEDTGIDGIRGSDPPWYLGDNSANPAWTVESQDYNYASGQYDYWDINGNGEHDPSEPFSSDNWSYSAGTSEYQKINGTESNETDEYRYPDTEDLDGSLQAEKANSFFRYRFRLNNAADYTKYVRGGQDNEARWRLIRIPIEDVFDSVNNPSLTDIRYLRFWFGNFASRTRVKIAQFELVGNEWQDSPVIDVATRDTVTYVTGTTINTYDNFEDYSQPPGVSGDIDPVTNLRRREQSLVVKILDMPESAEGELVKYLYNSQDLREYRYLKMFVHGGGRHPERLTGKNLEMFLRFGSGFEGSSNKGYYEYSQKLNPGWSGNNITIDLDRLTTLKKTAADNGETSAYEILPNGDVIKVVGTPSLGAVQVYSIGIRNLGRPISRDEELEMWVDELRLSDVRKESGMALRTSFNASLADVMNVSGTLTQRDATFHQVDQRVGSSSSNISGTLDAQINLEKMFDPNWNIRLPLHGNVSSSLSIPRYTTTNGDILVTSLEEGRNLNIWSEYAKKALSQDHIKDRYLLDDTGEVVVDSVTGIEQQDPTKWGIDTLLTTNQSYSWSLQYSKAGKNSNPLVKYTLDNITWKLDHRETAGSSLRRQYDKSFTNAGNLNYNLAFPSANLKVFKWTEGLPILKGLSESAFNYWPTKFNTGLNVNQLKTSGKSRNALERPSSTMNLSRNISTGIAPFRSFGIDYNYSITSDQIQADSVLQRTVYQDRSKEEVETFWPPSTDPRTIIDSTSVLLRYDVQYYPPGPVIADSAEKRLFAGVSADEVVRLMFDEIDQAFPGNAIRHPWTPILVGDMEFKDRFWHAFGMNFGDTKKSQTINLRYSPRLLSWFDTGFNYRTAYNWQWSGWTYSGRNVQSNNNLGGNFTLKLRQLLRADSRSKGTQSTSRERQGLPRGGFEPGGTTPPQKPSNAGPKGEGGKDSVNVKQPNPLDLLKAMLNGARKMQDIRVDYTQSLNYVNPTVESGSASFLYQLGLSGDPGLNTLPGYTSSVGVSRTDNYRISTGIDWSARLNTGLDYNYQWSRSHSSNANGNNINGSLTRGGFYYYNTTSKKITWLDLPNYSVRWSGLEQFILLQNLTQAVNFDHAFRGSVTENWNVIFDQIEQAQVRQTLRKSYDKNFAPLAGLNITWKYGISSQFRYNWSQTLSADGSNGQLDRSTTQSYSVQANYTRKSGFRIPLPIWPFKNRSFNNETTFSLAYDNRRSLGERRLLGEDWTPNNKSSDWSVAPSINYKFSQSVSGSARYKYGVTSTIQNTRRYQEFGINVNISIHG
ncbi:MAG: cell surface protein SprA [bacterium]